MRPERQKSGPSASALLSDKPKEGFLITKKRKIIWESPPGPDDPIYKEGFTVYTPRSHRPKPRPKAPPKEDANE